MAAKNVKAWHVTVMDGWKTLVTKSFFEVIDANKFYEEMKAEYAGKPNIMIFRENY